MLYRRKVLLNLLNVFGGELDKLSLTKLLLILKRTDGASQCYDFIPYKFGCFSYSAYTDLKCMHKEGLLSETENNVSLINFSQETYPIKLADKQAIHLLHEQFKDKSKEEIIKFTYEKYPYYASRTTLKQYITKDIKERIKECFSQDTSTTLFTIGYEGISAEEYLNQLLRNNIKTLIDVRKNPLSMKYGFSKSLLQKRVNDLGINYIHIPELGIESDKRQALNSYEDYLALFENYEKGTLKNADKFILKIFNILIKDKRVALTCFEKDSRYCHRTRIANKLATLPNWKYKTEHL
ncbi:MAG: DUF488 domain-containing protein [Elusimicrobiota bacterium]|jgi:uncharacterized protein (DUF488 family)|nr:DUF488 domain-containing protein [Elusimicrobiota bacterium]